MPRFVLARRDEVLDLHLLELAHAEDEVARRDLVAERLADLRDAERQLAIGRVEHVLEVDEDALRRLGPQVGERLRIGDRADLRLEHHVERPRLGQVAVEPQFGAHVVRRAGRRASASCSCAVDHRVDEGLLVAGVAPDELVHQDRGVDALHVVALLDVGAPPGGLEVVLQLDAERAVVVGSLQSAVDIRSGKENPRRLHSETIWSIVFADITPLHLTGAGGSVALPGSATPAEPNPALN